MAARPCDARLAADSSAHSALVLWRTYNLDASACVIAKQGELPLVCAAWIYLTSCDLILPWLVVVLHGLPFVVTLKFDFFKQKKERFGLTTHADPASTEAPGTPRSAAYDTCYFVSVWSRNFVVFSTDPLIAPDPGRGHTHGAQGNPHHYHFRQFY